MADLVVTQQVVIGLLVVASLVAIASSYLRQPYTVALVVVGLALSLSGSADESPLSRDLLLLVFLPPLLFESAISLDLDDLRRSADRPRPAVPSSALSLIG